MKGLRSKMDLGFYGVFIAAGVLGAQYFFSTRNHALWGAIIPAAYAVFITWLFVTNQIDHVMKYVLILLLGLLFLLGEWKSGRTYLREKRKKELDKMRAMDMN
ncbi:hypothetical protein [Insulibacter thermoxylanivorax]|nr:hypothetical protein [Insulibacter thermoxylanivorax]